MIEKKVENTMKATCEKFEKSYADVIATDPKTENRHCLRRHEDMAACNFCDRKSIELSSDYLLCPNQRTIQMVRAFL